MKKINDSYRDNLLVPNINYDIGINDGTIFKELKYLGTKLYHRKPMMCFETNKNRKITINPSYHSYTIQKGEIDNG